MLQSGAKVKIYDTPAGGICASQGTFSSSRSVVVSYYHKNLQIYRGLD